MARLHVYKFACIHKQIHRCMYTCGKDIDELVVEIFPSMLEHIAPLNMMYTQPTMITPITNLQTININRNQ